MATDYLGDFPGGGGGDTGQQPSYIGVPKDYVRPVDQTSLSGHAYDLQGQVGLTPLYKTGDEERRLAGLSAEELARLQGRMAQVGLIGPSTRFRLGQMDTPTLSAYRSLLSLANRYGWSDSDALDAIGQNPQLKGSQVTVDANGNLVAASAGPHKETTTQKTITDPVYTDPATAREALRQQWEQSFGRAPTAAEYRRYAHRLRAAEAGADVTTQRTTTQYDATGRATDSTTHVSRQDDTTDPSAATVADQMSRQGKLGRERNTRMVGVDYFGAIMNLPGMSASG